MSQSTVCDAAATLAATIPGIVAAQVGRWDTVAWTDTPGVLVYADAPTRETVLSFGPNGIVQVEYIVHLDCVLGGQTLEEPDATALAHSLADGFRAVFWGDRTLGGTAFLSTLGAATDNLRDYRRDTFEGQDRYAGYPVVAWQLAVTEHVTASSAATE